MQESYDGKLNKGNQCDVIYTHTHTFVLSFAAHRQYSYPPGLTDMVVGEYTVPQFLLK